MTFSSMLFLHVFFAALFVCYFGPWVKRRETKNLILLIFSLVFYGWGEPVYVLLMLLSIAVAFFTGFWIEKSSTKRAKKWAMRIGIGIALSFLLYFKYTDFNVSVKKEMELIDKAMRKPLRKRYKI